LSSSSWRPRLGDRHRNAALRSRDRTCTRRVPTWSQFLKAQASGIIACDFFTVETALLGTLYVLFLIETGRGACRSASQRAARTRSSSREQARNLAMCLFDEGARIRFLIRPSAHRHSERRPKEECRSRRVPPGWRAFVGPSSPILGSRWFSRLAPPARRRCVRGSTQYRVQTIRRERAGILAHAPPGAAPRARRRTHRPAPTGPPSLAGLCIFRHAPLSSLQRGQLQCERCRQPSGGVIDSGTRSCWRPRRASKTL
jgi:hypothetical protein